MGMITKLLSLLKTRIWKTGLDDSERCEMYCEVEQSCHKVGRTLNSLLDDLEPTLLDKQPQKIVKYASTEEKKDQ